MTSVGCVAHRKAPRAAVTESEVNGRSEMATPRAKAKRTRKLTSSDAADEGAVVARAEVNQGPEMATKRAKAKRTRMLTSSEAAQEGAAAAEETVRGKRAAEDARTTDDEKWRGPGGQGSDVALPATAPDLQCVTTPGDENTEAVACAMADVVADGWQRSW